MRSGQLIRHYVKPAAATVNKASSDLTRRRPRRLASRIVRPQRARCAIDTATVRTLWRQNIERSDSQPGEEFGALGEGKMGGIGEEIESTE